MYFCPRDVWYVYQLLLTFLNLNVTNAGATPNPWPKLKPPEAGVVNVHTENPALALALT
jgi:hypothetical protein